MCEVCKKQLNELAVIHDKFASNQKRLYDFAKKLEAGSTEKEDSDILMGDPAEFLIPGELVADPLILQDIKTEKELEPVVIKVECFDNEIVSESCFEEIEIPEDVMSTLDEVNETFREPNFEPNFERKKYQIIKRKEKICLKCGKIINADVFKEHLATHKNDEPQPAPEGYKFCPICNIKLKKKRSFYKHVSLIFQFLIFSIFLIFWFFSFR